MPQAINPLVAAMMAGRGGQMTIGRGLNSLGAGLAAGIMQRSEQKKLMEAMEGLMPPEVEQPVQSDEQRNLISALMSQSAAPGIGSTMQVPAEQRGAAGAAADRGLGIVADQTKAAMDKRKRLEFMVKSGDPALQAAAKKIMVSGDMPKDPKATGVTGGYVDENGNFVQTAKPESKLDDPSKRYTVETIGDTDYMFDNGVIDPETGQPKILKQGKNLKDKSEVWTAAGQDASGAPQQQLFLRNPETNQMEPAQLAGGEPALRTQPGTRQVTSNVEASIDRKIGVMLATENELLDQSLVRVANIRKSYKPEYLSLAGKVGHKVREIKDFVAPGSMSAKDKKTLGEQAVFYQNSIRDVNQTIRDITGAAMNKDESVRIMEQVANLDDTGTVFIYKLLNSQKMFAEAAKRKQQKLKELTDVGVKWEEAMPVAKRYAAAYMISAGAASEAEARQLAETDAWGLEDVGTDTFDPGPDYEQQEDGSWIYTGGE